MSKLKAGESRCGSPSEAIQILGGYGYIARVPRRALAPRREDLHIFEGTEEIQQLVIARAISGLRIE